MDIRNIYLYLMVMNITIVLLLATVAVSLVAFINEQRILNLILNPYMVQYRKQW